MAARLDGPSNGRSKNGTFAVGNPGGPGRPKRPVELQYLMEISNACPLDKWKLIVNRAVEDALTGDASARDWLAKYLVGKPNDRPLDSLLVIAARELLGITIGNTIEGKAADVRMASQVMQGFMRPPQGKPPE